MTAVPRKTADLREDWAALRALAVALRGTGEDELGDWDPEDTEQAIYAWEIANLPFDDALTETYRELRDPDGSPASLRGTARSRSASVPGASLTREERDELRARAIADCEAATEAQHQQAKARDVA